MTPETFGLTVQHFIRVSLLCGRPDCDAGSEAEAETEAEAMLKASVGWRFEWGLHTRAVSTAERRRHIMSMICPEHAKEDHP